MRNDFDRIITERPRRGSRARNRGTAAKVGPGYEGQSRIAMRRTDKQLTDLLGPLRRYLRSNLGRPWNKIYSEICQVADSRTLRGAHLLEHLRWEVEMHCVLDGKRPVAPSFGGYRPVRGFYVHPKSGLLRFAKYRT